MLIEIRGCVSSFIFHLLLLNCNYLLRITQQNKLTMISDNEFSLEKNTLEHKLPRAHLPLMRLDLSYLSLSSCPPSKTFVLVFSTEAVILNSVKVTISP